MELLPTEMEPPRPRSDLVQCLLRFAVLGGTLVLAGAFVAALLWIGLTLPQFAEFTSSCISGFLAILATELGDKTFFIAAVLSMRHERLHVFGGAYASLVLMTILACIVGNAAPLLISWHEFTHYAAVAVLAFFGVRMVLDARDANDGVSEELQEVEAAHSVEHADLDREEMREQYGYVITMAEAFALTFAAEWGDRSQIAILAMAADEDAWGVGLGASLGHSICTGLAVLGGRLLAGRISQRAVLVIGGLLFIGFAAVLVVRPSASLLLSLG